MSKSSRRLAGILLAVYPSVIFGGASLLSMLTDPDSGYQDNRLRQDLWRAGHAHAGVLLILSLVVLKYVDEASLPQSIKNYVRYSVPASAILLPVAYFLSVLPKDAKKPNPLVYLAYVGGILLATGLFTLGVGLLRKAQEKADDTASLSTEKPPVSAI